MSMFNIDILFYAQADLEKALIGQIVITKYNMKTYK